MPNSPSNSSLLAVAADHASTRSHASSPIVTTNPTTTTTTTNNNNSNNNSNNFASTNNNSEISSRNTNQSEHSSTVTTTTTATATATATAASSIYTNQQPSESVGIIFEEVNANQQRAYNLRTTPGGSLVRSFDSSGISNSDIDASTQPSLKRARIDSGGTNIPASTRMILDPLNNMGKTSGSTTLAESSRNAMGLTSVAQNGNGMIVETEASAGKTVGISSNGSNGIASVNGDSTNGASSSSSLSEFTPGGFRREELVRLMQHTLQELGYSKSADQLQHESGYLAEDSVAMQFRQSVLNGQWSTVEGLLPSIGYDMTHKVEGQFYIRRQKYLEYLEQRQMSEALMVLQQELRPLQYDLAQLHLLSSLLMSSHEDLYERAAWDGRHGKSRLELLRVLQKHISSYRMIPYGRLEALLRETINEQARNCIYHNVPNEAISLFGNHCCDQHNLPSETLHQLTKHTNEVWCVAFSHDGRYLASASKDRTAIIWETTNYQMVHKLDRHTGEVTYVSWSHDDTRLLTCSNDKHARVWNVQSGECILDIDRHREHVVAGAWLKDNSFVTGGLDKELFLWSLEGELKHQWTIGRVTDLDVSKDGKRLVATSQDQRLRVYDIPSKTLVCTIQLKHNISSVLLSEDGRYALLGLELQPLTIWDLDNKRLVHRYHGHTQNRFVIRSCFGGVNEGFVASGSEDYNVCLWHRESEKLISTLKGHTMAVNDISWHPRNPAIFASASDDHTIRIWGPTASTTVSSKSPSIAIINNDKSTVFQCDIDDGNDDDEDDDDEDEENENENDVDDDDEEEEEEEEEDDDDDNESEETG